MVYFIGMYYTYLVTNLVNGKRYFGVRLCEALSPERDGKYLGSGNLIKQAIKKYGRDNFRKDIDGIFDTAEEAYSRESEVVDDDWVKDGMTYNLRQGGMGGVKATAETRRKISKASAAVQKTPEWNEKNRQAMLGREFTEETIAKMGTAQRKRFEANDQWNKGESAKDNPSMSRYRYVIETADGQVFEIENGIKYFCLEYLGTAQNVFRRLFNIGIIPKPTSSRTDKYRKMVTGWKIDRFRKRDGKQM